MADTGAAGRRASLAATAGVPGRGELALVAAELLGADVGVARAADLDRAVRAAGRKAGEPLAAGALARRLRSAPPGD
ncbi:MAG TPA: hypothetical protein VGR20_24585, partial [Acidimicrobiia bacterium]|nr:hypothetical protein [Acidimicrobiia bacterium]